MLLARSAEECHLYIELHPYAAERLLSIYEGVCRACGTPRRFEFEVTGELPAPPAYGGRAASRIIDPSTFLAVSGELAAAVPADPAPLDPATRDHGGEAIEMAIAALDEVLKFIPDGADRVPADAFHTDAGRSLHQREPGRFERQRLHQTRAEYERIQAAYAAVSG